MITSSSEKRTKYFDFAEMREKKIIHHWITKSTASNELMLFDASYLFHLNRDLNAWNPHHAPTLSSPTLIARIADGINSPRNHNFFSFLLFIFIFIRLLSLFPSFLPLSGHKKLNYFPLHLVSSEFNNLISFYLGLQNTFLCVNNLLNL